MTNGIEVVIIGAGQAGLAVSHELAQAGVAHVVLERGRVGQTWRERWDSFCLVTPNWFCQLPGHPYDGSDPDGFMLRDEVVAYLERYAAGVRRTRAGRCRGRLRYGRDPPAASAGDLRRRDRGADRGPQHRRLPAPAPAGRAATLPPELLQIDVEDYRNPAGLPPGPVLVVGSGQSGCQIAEELHEAGREVFLACGRAPWLPRRLGDRDLALVGARDGLPRPPLSSLPSPAARLAATSRRRAPAAATTCTSARCARGRDPPRAFPRRRRPPRRFAATSARASPGAMSERAAHGSRSARSSPNADCGRLRSPSPSRSTRGARGGGPRRLRRRGLRGRLPARLRSWVRFPGAFDGLGFPIHHEGASTVVHGLYFVGVHFLRKRKSSLLIGVGEDATIVAREIVARNTRPAAT